MDEFTDARIKSNIDYWSRTFDRCSGHIDRLHAEGEHARARMWEHELEEAGAALGYWLMFEQSEE